MEVREGTLAFPLAGDNAETWYRVTGDLGADGPAPLDRYLFVAQRHRFFNRRPDYIALHTRRAPIHHALADLQLLRDDVKEVRADLRELKLMFMKGIEKP